jgi:L-lactate dehydrogenase complex protein LldG
MAEERDEMLGRIRHALRRGPLGAEAKAALDARMARHVRNLVPARTNLPAERLLALFVRMAQEVSASVERVPDLDHVPAAVADYLAAHNLPADIRIAADAALAGVPWQTRPTLVVATGRAEDGDRASVTGALAGIAESGTLMMASSAGHPTTLNFMPETHIVVLQAGAIVGSYEDAWDLLRARAVAEGRGLPRTVNLITGPSRTGDIEQTIQLGAHGPRRLHIIVVGDPTAEGERRDD